VHSEREKVELEKTYKGGKVFLGERFLLTQLNNSNSKNAIIQIFLPYIKSSYVNALNGTLEKLFFDYRLLNQSYFFNKIYPFEAKKETEKLPEFSQLVDLCSDKSNSVKKKC